MEATKYASIPTLYNGVKFRSRLEARWACLFDMLSWQWVYEPFDAGGYIPDFLIRFSNPLVVEVKPIFEENDFRWGTTAKRMRDSGIQGEILVVGARVMSSVKDDYCSIGFGLSGMGKMHFCMTQGCGDFTPFDRCLCDQSHRDLSQCAYNHLDSKWKMAGNVVQWKGNQ